MVHLSAEDFKTLHQMLTNLDRMSARFSGTVQFGSSAGTFPVHVEYEESSGVHVASLALRAEQ